MVGAAITALILRCNVPVSVGLCWLTNPITMPSYFVIAYTLGAWILNSNLSLPNDNITSMDTRTAGFDLVPVAHWLNSNRLGVSMGLLGLVSLRLWWRWRVNHEWKDVVDSLFIRRSGADHDAIQTVGRSERRLDDHESQ